MPSTVLTGIIEKKAHKHVEDLIDTIILSVCIENNAILFTNDKELAIYALSRGIYPISYNGLEDDIKDVVRQYNLEITREELVGKVQMYAEEVRGTSYNEDDIRRALERLIRRGEVGVLEKQGKELLFYIGPKRRRKPRAL